MSLPSSLRARLQAAEATAYQVPVTERKNLGLRVACSTVGVVCVAGAVTACVADAPASPTLARRVPPALHGPDVVIDATTATRSLGAGSKRRACYGM
jgi:hypothetical protein